MSAAGGELVEGGLLDQVHACLGEKVPVHGKTGMPGPGGENLVRRGVRPGADEDGVTVRNVHARGFGGGLEVVSRDGVAGRQPFWSGTAVSGNVQEDSASEQGR